MSEKRVFVSIPVQGRRLPSGVYDSIIASVERVGMTVVNHEVNRPPADGELYAISPETVHAYNRTLLDSASCVISEISRPSLGVGYELAIAETKGIPILALCDVAWLDRSSVMIRGIEAEHFHLAPYADLSDIERLIDAFAAGLLPGRVTSTRAITEHFDDIAAVYDDSTEWRQDSTLLDWIARRTQGRLCLDVGTGTGLIAGAAGDAGRVVVGIDRSMSMLRRSRIRVGLRVGGDAISLPFADASFDAASLRSVLHYVDDAACLRELHRVVKIGGSIACAQATAPDVDAAAWWGAFKKVTHPYRRRFYTPAMLIGRFEQAGLIVTETERTIVAREERWENILRRCGKSEAEAARRLVDEIPEGVREAAALRVNETGLRYEQQWTLIAARRPGTA